MIAGMRRDWPYVGLFVGWVAGGIVHDLDIGFWWGSLAAVCVGLVFGSATYFLRRGEA